MTAGCAACGWCCDPVWLRIADLERLRGYLGTEDEGPNTRFITARWHQAGEPDEAGWIPLTCEAFDPQTRLCTAHEDRPPVCRSYPWYDRGPDPETAGYLSPQCSYLADLPPAERPEGARPLIPLTAISH